MTDQSGDCENSRSRRPEGILAGDRVAIVALVVLVLTVFFRTVFNAKPISKLCRLANWDSVFQQYSNNSVGSCDPSLVQLLLPNYFLVAKLWHQLTIPLWNQYSGCGMPLIGDIQASVFAPVHLALAFFPSARTYNLILIGEIGFCLLGAYALGRLLTLERLPATLSCLAYTFSPYVLYYLELLSGTSQALLPALLASYVYAARCTGRLPLLAATLMTATFVLSGHPESSLYGVTFACLLYFTVGYSRLGHESSSGRSPVSLWRNLLKIGVLSFGLSAPVLLPFVEFLSCGDSYKYGDGAAAYAPWQGLVLNLIQPCYGPSSPFLGAIAWLLMPLSIFAARRQRLLLFSLAAMALVSLSFIGRLGWLDAVLNVRPLSYLITVYLIPMFLLFASLMAGLGLQVLTVRRQPYLSRVYRKIFRVVGTAASIAVLVPLAVFYSGISLSSFDFDQTLPSMHFELHSMFLNIALVVFFLVLLKLFDRAEKQKIVVWSAILLNLLSSLSIARTALPIQPYFDFPKTQITDFLKQHPGRVVSVVEHVLKPNANIVYGIPSLRVHNPLLPARFADFSVLCGAHLDDFRNQSYTDIADFVDLASVKYLVSQFKPLPPRYRQIFTSSEGIAVYENARSMPEAYLVANCRLASSKADALAMLTSTVFDPRLEVILELEKKSTEASFEPSSLPRGQNFMQALSPRRPSPNQVVVNYSSPEPACLVLTDTFYPGWRATIDGKEAVILRANFLFRAIVVPAGDHNVSFDYDPLSFRLGSLLGLLSLLAISIALIMPIIFGCNTKSKSDAILKA